MPTGVPDLPDVLVVQAPPPSKKWWKSRTLWLNAAVLGLAAAESQLRVLEPWVPEGPFALIAFGLPVANAMLRLVTDKALTS